MKIYAAAQCLMQLTCISTFSFHSDIIRRCPFLFALSKINCLQEDAVNVVY